MSLNDQQLSALYEKYIQNQCSPEELQALVEALGADAPVFRQELVTDLFDTTWEGLEAFPGRHLLPEQAPMQAAEGAEAPVVPLAARPRRYRWAAAAAVLLLLGGTAWWTLDRKQPFIASVIPAAKEKDDVPPGYSKAQLTLADGSVISLDSAHTGALARQGGTSVVNAAAGQLAYNVESKPAELLYNQLSTPRGGQYRLVLPDGSKVWLNAASSIRYPTAFIGRERRVEIKGEAYFDIARNTAMPFSVAVLKNGGAGEAVEVLGTQFNVNAYDDEPVVTTTLLEGAVKVRHNGDVQVLKPGQQALAETGAAIRLQDHADTEAATAWKDGRFYFNGADIQTIMRQVARWYDVSVVYEGNIPSGHYKGRPARNLSLSEMLKVVEYSGVHCRIEGKKIIVQE